MNRIALIGVLVVSALGAALAAGWNLNDSRPAASVNGIEISSDDLMAELDAVMGNEDLSLTIDPVSSDADVAASILTSRIYDSVFADALADRGVPVTDEDRQQATRDLILDLGQGNPNAPNTVRQQAIEAGTAVFDSFDADRQATLVETRAVQSALGADLLDPADVEAAVALNEVVCLSHILVVTEEEALGVLAELNQGMAFEIAAQSFSADPGSPDGNLGCNRRGTFIPEFEEPVFAADPLATLGPLQTPAGWHLIKLHDTRAALAADLELSALRTLLAADLADADIEVNSRWGSWDSSVFQVQPPRAPEPEPFDFSA